MEQPTYGSKVHRILVVEDNLDAVHTICMLLREMGHVADYAINGYVALDLARRLKPDIVLLDIGLPGPSGFDVAVELRRDPETKNVGIIVLTAYDRPELRERARNLRCLEYLVKPLPVSELNRLFGDPLRRSA